MDSASTPVALKNKGAPAIRDGVRLRLPHFYLGGSERCGWAQSILKHSMVKQFHQVGRGLVVYIPQTGHYSRRSGVHESARQTDQSFSGDILSQRGLAAAQDDQVCVESHVVNFVQPQK